MSDEAREDSECIVIWKVYRVCKGQKISAYIRGTRGSLYVEGVVADVSKFAISIKDKRGRISVVRLSEIKMIEEID